MTQDPYENDLTLSANSGDDGDEFDGLEAPKSSSKTPLIALICLVLLAGAAFLVYQLFLTGDDDFVPPAPPAAVAEAPQVPPPQPEMPPSPEQPMTDAGTTPPGVTDPNAAVQPVPGTDPASTDPNAVTAEAVPAPPVSNDPAAAPVPPSAPDATTATATPSSAETPVSAPAVPEAAQAPTDGASTTPAAQVEPAPAVPAAPQEVAQEATQAPQPAPPAAAALPTPPAEQLKPIDPATGATADVPPEPLPMGTATTPTDQKVAKTINEVNEILGADAKDAVAVTKKVDANISKQVEVTPRARQVIIVKKNYSAQSSQAIVAAGDRVLQAGQYGGAVEIFDRQLAKNPSDPLALAGKAEALQRSGRTAEAMEVYDRLLDLNPRDLEALTNYLGLLQKQDPNQALGRLLELSRQYPENAAVNGQLGMTYASMMDTPNALRAFQKAAALDATNATYPFNLAVLYDRLGTSDKARDQYLRALRLVRDYPNRASGVPIESIRNRLSSMPF